MAAVVGKHLGHVVLFLRDSLASLGVFGPLVAKKAKNTLLSPLSFNSILPSQAYLEHNAETLGALFALLVVVLFLLSCFKKS